MIYCIRITVKLSVDLPKAIADKMAENAVKYPVSLSKGEAA